MSSLESQLDDKRQRFVDNFDGKALDTDKWLLESISGGGSPSAVMLDEVDQGLRLNHTSGTAIISTNLIRQYDPLNSSCLFELRTEEGINEGLFAGLWNDKSGFVQFVMGISTTLNPSVYIMQNRDGGSATTVGSSVSLDLNFHRFYATINSTTLTGSIDGGADLVSVTNLPTSKLMPEMLINGINKSGRIRYYEAWNND